MAAKGFPNGAITPTEKDNLAYVEKNLRDDYRFIAYTNSTNLRPERIERTVGIGDFVRIPFNRRNCTMWMFKDQQSLDVFILEYPSTRDKPSLLAAILP